MKNGKSVKREETNEIKDRLNSKSTSRMTVQEELFRKFQLSENEIDELK
jgi:hypothetical protein